MSLPDPTGGEAISPHPSDPPIDSTGTQANCRVDTCELSVGFISSIDGGSSWAAPLQLAGPFKNTWLPLRFDGYFPGDYFSVSFVDEKAVPVFTVASEGTCELGDITSCNVRIASATIPVVPGSQLAYTHLERSHLEQE